MYNQDLLNKLLEQFSKEDVAKFAEIVSVMYDIKYNACKHLDSLSEYDYEREWWFVAGAQLKEQLKTE